MTNYSAPPTQPPPPGDPPPPGYGGGAVQPGMPPPQRGNGWAIASLICGIFGCVPLITSLCAVIFGIIGIRKSGQPHTGGKGLAIAGLILGMVGLIAWPLVGGATYWGWRQAEKMVFEPARQTGTTFLSSLAAGDTATARSLVTSDMSAAELQRLRDDLSSLGEFKTFNLSEFDVQQTGAQAFRMNASGTAVFEEGSRGFDAVLVGSADTGVKIEDFRLK